MVIAEMLKSHVYTAIVLGSLLEGETTVVLAGFAAHQGYAPWWTVTLLAATINFCWDQTLYAFGRWRGEWLLVHLPRLRPKVERLAPRLHQHRRWVIFGVRFMYGLRIVGPLALGSSRVPWRDFLLFNALGALVWAVLFSSLGYLFGKTIAAALGTVVHYETVAVAMIMATGLLALLIHWLRRNLKMKHG